MGSALVYSTYLGGGGQTGNGDQGNGIAVDTQRNAYVTGFTGSTDFPVKNAFQKELKGSQINAFVTKIDAADCALVYSTYLGGSFRDSPYGIAIDPSGNAYVTGSALSADFPTKNAFQDTLKGFNGNAFVTKISAK